MLSIGEATIACTAVNGVSNSMVLHVYDPEETPVQKAKSLQLEFDSPMLFPGEYNQAVGIMGSGAFTQGSFAALQQAIAAANEAIDDDCVTLEEIAAVRVELLRALR